MYTQCEFVKMASQLYMANLPFELSPRDIQNAPAEAVPMPVKVVCLKEGTIRTASAPGMLRTPRAGPVP